MPGPWDKYAQAQPAASDGPWAKYSQPKPDQVLPDTNVTAPPEESTLHALGRNALMQAREFGKGVASLGGIVIDPVTRTINYAAQKTGLDPSGKYAIPTVAGSVDYALNTAGVPNPQPQNNTEAMASRIAGGLGGVAGGVGVGSLVKQAPGVVGNIGNVLTQNIGAQTASGATGAAASELARQQGVGTGGQIVAGLAGGLAPAALEASSQGAANIGAKLLGPVEPQTANLAAKAQAAGIPLKASQLSSSKVAKLVDSGTGQVPFSGAPKFAEQQQTAFNRAVGQTIGVDAEKITPQVFAQAKKAIGSQFNALAARNNMQITPDVISKLNALRSNVAASGNTEATTAIDKQFDRIVNQQNNSALPGTSYKSLFSELGRMASTGANPDKAYYAAQMREILAEAMDSSISPKDAQAWQQARQQYRDLKTIEPLMTDAAANGGNISPAKLMGRVAANKAGKSAVAQGTRGDLGDLGAIGQRFLKEPIQDSGTARRTALVDMLKGAGSVAGGALGAGAAVNPMAGLVTGATAVGIARKVQNILKNPRLLDAMLKSPKTDPALRNALQAAIAPTASNMNQQQ